MRARTSGRRAALAALTGVLVLGPAVPVALAEPGDGPGGTPSRSDVEDARAAVGDKAREIAAVQADLLLAEQRRQEAAIRSAQAFEAWNGARWELREARREVREAEARAGQAQDELAVHETAYAEVLAAAYEMSPEVTTLSAIVDEDGVDGVVEQANAMFTMTTSMDEVQGSYEAALRVADLAGDRAATARETAEELAGEAGAARDLALAEEQAAAQEAAQVASERETLIAELAELQDISVSMAAERQAALEQAAQQRLAEAAAAEQQAAADATPASPAPAPGDAPAPQQPSQPDPQPSQPQPAPQPQPDPEPDPQPAPQPEPDPQPAPAPTPDPQPAPSPPPPSPTGAQSAISFARAQLGEPYRWGGAGPSSWDCSGLMMKAWGKGGKWIGRTSRDQYALATPISAGQLRPGDLLFWTNGGASGIYHVAMYTGNGRMIHAPNSSRPVVEESMYIWPPSLYARP